MNVIADEFKRLREKAGKELHVIMDDIIERQMIKDTDNKSILRMELLTIVDRIEEKRNEMIRWNRLYQEFEKR
jgi:hypothetical protein